MVELTRIYTKGGDKGQTSLSSGERVAKDDARVDAYGTVDEANAALGLARLYLDSELDPIIGRVQNDLFDLGADLATPEGPDYEWEPIRIAAPQVDYLEEQIDHYNALLEPLKSFVLPAGTPAASYFHLARTVARRAERNTVTLAGERQVNPEAIRYLNRLSDLLFVLARYSNLGTVGDVLWEPKKNQ